MEQIIEKLDKLEYGKKAWNNWSKEEIKLLLNMDWVISKKEASIFELIYQYHGCDSWEDIFRDYNEVYLDDKAVGVKEALDNLD
jgi:hypothetical protein